VIAAARRGRGGFELGKTAEEQNSGQTILSEVK
jgi:hypothetical protein